MNNLNLKNTTENLIDTFLKAGKIAKEISRQGVKVTIKPDKSPVTDGDLAVDELLRNKIKISTPDIPIISEETADTNIKIAKDEKNFWLIDPIDGTFDYVHNKDEFTINAALIINNKPAIGLINAPAKKRLFYSYGLGFSFELKNNKEIQLNCKKLTNPGQIKAVSYSNNLKPEILEQHKKFQVTEYKKMKSSLKFCVIATGEYDLYVAEPRASEWDIAAGHAILKDAGGKISDFSGNEILYGKKDFKNPSIILKRSSVL